MKIAEACESYLRDLAARNIRKTTREGYSYLFRQFQDYAASIGAESLADLDTNVMRRWREQWTCAFSTQRKRLAQLKAFFTFAESEGWVEESPVSGIRSPKPDSRPTMPLSVDDVRAMLEASAGKPKEHALLLLLRYSGLAISDAVTLERSAVHSSGELILRRAKSGELVTVLLPGEALAALKAIEPPARRHYFWTGESDPVTACKYWRNRLKLVAIDAGIDGFHPHRLRDTFAVELLLSGMCIDDVSTLLGHSSVRTTEKYYAPWNGARRRRLARLVSEVHRQDPILAEVTVKKPPGTVTAAPGEASLATSNVPKPTRMRSS